MGCLDYFRRVTWARAILVAAWAITLTGTLFPWMLAGATYRPSERIPPSAGEIDHVMPGTCWPLESMARNCCHWPTLTVAVVGTTAVSAEGGNGVTIACALFDGPLSSPPAAAVA